MNEAVLQLVVRLAIAHVVGILWNEHVQEMLFVLVYETNPPVKALHTIMDAMAHITL